MTRVATIMARNLSRDNAAAGVFPERLRPTLSRAPSNHVTETRLVPSPEPN
ncbi:hypothetical protein FRUB_01941 [Fimbriiglobus ruber]|uniref:Uncharacterized protein n=1 Tax=Fimbriiglobus ruber TaxID=1908690 RepID=A0A225DVP6_9BACT|nr:hypothetical protein FRUB_01941 [Fimbriiglobus ruber]